MNTEGKSLKLKNEAYQMIDTIVSNCTANNYTEISTICCSLTKTLFSDHSLLYTDLNKYFDSSDVVLLLMKSINIYQEQARRDVLRLLYVLFQVNHSLREKARKNDIFQSFLLKQLDQRDCWENQTQFKHHINVASLLLVDNDATECQFNIDSVRKYALRAIVAGSKKGKSEDIPPCLVFYACSMFSETFEDIPTNSADEPASETMLTKEITGKCLDVMRNYIQDFKLFYSNNGGEKNQYIKYHAKAGYSFLQISNTIIYYSVQSKKLRENMIQAGLYEMINHLLSLTETDESILKAGLDILKIPLIDVTECLKGDLYKSINGKLNNQLKRENLSEKVKQSIHGLLKSYDLRPIVSIEGTTMSDLAMPADRQSDEASLIHFTNFNGTRSQSSSVSMSFDKWKTMDVQQWLHENNLDSLKPILANLTGNGLSKLKSLAKEQNPMTVIDYMMDKMKISFDVTLELLGALEKL